MRRTFTSAIAEHIQPLNIAIGKDRSDRVPAVSEVRVQLTELRDDFRASVSTSGSRIHDTCYDDVCTDENIITTKFATPKYFMKFHPPIHWCGLE